MIRLLMLWVAAAIVLTPGVVARGQADSRLPEFEGRLRSQILAVIDSASAAGVPAEALLDRAREGRTKGAPGEAIVGAVRARAAKLSFARSLLGLADENEIKAAEGALDAGLDPETIRLMRSRRKPGTSLTTPLGLLELMLRQGIPPKNAAATMLLLTARGLGDDDMREFWSMVERDIALGMLPSASALLRAETFGIADMESTRGNTGNPPAGSAPPPRPIPPARP